LTGLCSDAIFNSQIGKKRPTKLGKSTIPQKSEMRGTILLRFLKNKKPANTGFKNDPDV